LVGVLFSDSTRCQIFFSKISLNIGISDNVNNHKAFASKSGIELEEASSSFSVSPFDILIVSKRWALVLNICAAMNRASFSLSISFSFLKFFSFKINSITRAASLSTVCKMYSKLPILEFLI